MHRLNRPARAVLWLALVFFTIAAPAAQKGFIAAWGAEGLFDDFTLPADATNIIAICAGDLAVREDGTLLYWGDRTDTSMIPPPISDVQRVARGSTVQIALRRNGTLIAWGWNNLGQTNVPENLVKVVDVRAGNTYGLALTEEGEVVAWGQDWNYGAHIVPDGLGPVKAIGTGLQHSLAVKMDGTVVAWGLNMKGACDPPADLTNAVAVAGGAWHSIALRDDGTVAVWGGFNTNTLAPPPGLSNVVAIAAGHFHNLALKRDGTVVTWGGDVNPQTDAQDLSEVFAISAGPYHNLALSTQKTPFILHQPVGGKFSSGQTVLLKVEVLGFGPFTYQWWKDGAPIPGATNASLAFPNASTEVDGDYYVVVTNEGGSLASATVNVRVVDSALFMLNGVIKSGFDFGAKEPPPGLSDLAMVESSLTHALALRKDGSVAGWKLRGGLTYGAENPPANLTNAISIACGLGFSLALKNDGSVVSWGDIPGTPMPLDLTNAVAIAAAGYFAFALTTNGAIVTFGDTPYAPGDTDIKKIVAYDYSLVGLRSDGSLTRWDPNNRDGVDEGRSGVVDFDAAFSNLVTVHGDGSVTGPKVPAGLTNVLAVSTGPKEDPVFNDGTIDLAYAMAIRPDRTVASWRGGPDTRGLTNVTLIHIHNNYPMVQTLWPAIVRQPQDLVLDVGSDMIFNVEMKGVGPFRFQWQKEGVDLAGETNIDLVIPKATPADQGKYSVTTFNKHGQMQSLQGTLAIHALKITNQPTDEVSFVGGVVAFSVEVSGSKPIAFQWLKNGAAIPNATNSVLKMANLQLADAGSYSVTMTNPAGTTNSRTSTLGMFPAPTWKHVAPGTVVSINGPPAPADLTNAIAIAAGAEHGIALRADGTVTQWTSSPVPLRWPIPNDLTNIVSISAHGRLFGAVRGDGTLVTWGDYTWITPPVFYGVIDFFIENQFTPLKVDGSWGYFQYVEVPANATPAVQVQLQSAASAALLRDGRVLLWRFEPPAAFISGVTNAIQIAADPLSVMVLLADGTVHGEYFFQRQPPAVELTDLAAIALGAPDYGLGLKRDGSVIGWGAASVPANLGPVTAIAAGGFGLVIQSNPTGPSLRIRATDFDQAILESDTTGFILESTDDLNTNFTPANTIRVNEPFALPKAQQYFRLRQAP